jgi:hypothetical protein
MFAKVAEIANEYRVSQDAVYLWIRQKKIPESCVVRIGGTIRVDKNRFESALRSGDLYTRPGTKRSPVNPGPMAEDSKTTSGRLETASLRWVSETGSVMPDHPYGRDPELQPA